MTCLLAESLIPRAPMVRAGLGAALLTMALPALAQSITVYGGGTLAVGGNRQLSAYVPYSPATVNWAVNGVPGGNSQVGTVSASGLYTAPAVVPAANVVTVSATSTVQASAVGTAQITVLQVQPRLWSLSPSSVPAGTVTLTLNGSAFTDSAVGYVNGTAVPTTRLSATQLRVTLQLDGSLVGQSIPVRVQHTGLGANWSETVQLSVTAATAPAPAPAPAPSPAPAPAPAPAPVPAPPSASVSASRFLDQGTFGASPADLARLQQLGQEAWLNEQFGMPATLLVNPGGMSMDGVRQAYLAQLSAAPDQLRQRVAFALAQVLVVSANKNVYPDELVPHLNLLIANAFGNYRALLGQVTRSAQMGKYLDLANSNRPSAGANANENYARELLQLFSVGLTRLNPDGTPQLDSTGRPLPTYSQAEVQQLALALTGWTYAGTGNNNWENFSGPLQPRDVNHDTRAKSFLGCNLPAGQSTTVELEAALDCVFAHPNVPPFVATRLIRQLVTSKPTPAYVQRVAATFANNGAGVRGDLRATVRAVLLDPEARNDSWRADFGRLKDPVQHLTSAVRAFGGRVLTTNTLAWDLGRMGQRPLTPPSVFGHYAAEFRLPRTTLPAPEFQIYTPTEATLRGNLFWRLLDAPGQDVAMDWSSLQALAPDPVALVQRVDQVLMAGRMPASMRSTLVTAAQAQSDLRQRTQLTVYLTLLSGLHAVQH